MTAPVAELNPGAGSFTVDLWVQATATADVFENLLIRHQFNADPALRKRWSVSIGNGASAGRLVYVVQDGAGGGVQLTGTHAVRDGAWHHVAMVLDRDAGLLRGYVDGADDGSSALGGTGDIAPDVPIVIGNAFTGALDELAVHGEALGADAIGAIVAAGAAGRCDGEAFASVCADADFGAPVPACPGCAKRLSCAPPTLTASTRWGCSTPGRTTTPHGASSRPASPRCPSTSARPG